MAVHLPFEGSRADTPRGPAPAAFRPAKPVFVDLTGVRRRRVQRVGLVVAAASLTYLPMVASALLPGPAVPAQAHPHTTRQAPTETGQPGTSPSPPDPYQVSGANHPLNEGAAASPPPVAPRSPGKPTTAPVRPGGSPRTSAPPQAPQTRPPARLPGTATPLPSPTSLTVGPLPTGTAPALAAVELTIGAAG